MTEEERKYAVRKLIFSKMHVVTPEEKLEQFKQKIKTKERIDMNSWEGSVVISNPPALHMLLPGDRITIFGIEILLI